LPGSAVHHFTRGVRARARHTLLALQPLTRRAGLSVPAWRFYERLLVLADRSGQPPQGADGLPLPPPALRVRVIAQTDPDVFLRSGASDCRDLARLAADGGVAIEAAGAILDFGCGCGRVLRHWPADGRVQIHGSDHDDELVDWIRANLPFVTPNVNALEPALPYADATFGLVYSISVFTHLTEELNEAWMREMHRIIRPGGLLLFSILAERNLDRLRPREREAFDAGRLVVQFDDAPGTNLCVAYHPDAYLDRLTAGFERVQTAAVGMQDVSVVRRLPDRDG
jgi:SAM-dependent methyltransferase